MATRKKTSTDSPPRAPRARRARTTPPPEVALTPAPEVEASPPAPAIEADAPAPAAPTHAAIAARAYAIWQARGGSALENWLEAERELRG